MEGPSTHRGCLKRPQVLEAQLTVVHEEWLMPRHAQVSYIRYFVHRDSGYFDGLHIYIYICIYLQFVAAAWGSAMER